MELERRPGTVEQNKPLPSITPLGGSWTGGGGGWQVNVVGSQIGALAGQLEPSTHCTHSFVCGLHSGAVDDGHSELESQNEEHVCEAWLQIGCVPLQSWDSRHSKQLFVAGSQTGLSAGHSSLLAHVVPHVFVARLQIDAAPVHRELSRHWTQRAFALLQRGLSLGH